MRALLPEVLPDELRALRRAQGRWAHLGRLAEVRRQNGFPASIVAEVDAAYRAARRDHEVARARLLYRVARRALYELGEPPPDWDPTVDDYLRTRTEDEKSDYDEEETR